MKQVLTANASGFTLRLRPWMDPDIPRMVAMDADPEVRRYVDQPTAPTEADYWGEVIPRWRKADATDDRVGFWMIEVVPVNEKEAGGGAGGGWAGWIHLKPPRPIEHHGPPPRPPVFPGDPVERDLELGYRLRREWWGKGIATAASRAMLEYGFGLEWRAGADGGGVGVGGGSHITAMALRANSASWRVMEKLGMRRVLEYDYVSKAGERKPAVLYAISREEWRAGTRGGAGVK